MGLKEIGYENVDFERSNFTKCGEFLAERLLRSEDELFSIGLVM